jgi:hypothetical protein
VVHRCECDLRSDLSAELLEHCVIKVLCIVDCYVSGNIVMADDVLPKEFLDCGGADIGERFHFYLFCKVFNSHHRKSIIAMRRG